MVAYHYTGNSIPGSALKDVVLRIVHEATAIGLRIIAVTSDMGPSNRAMWREFGISSTRSGVNNHIVHPVLNTCNLYFIADVPHLVKNLRTAFVKHGSFILSEDICRNNDLPTDTVSIDHVKDLIEFQANKDLKLAPKLCANTIDFSHFDKMNVGNALHLFSRSTSAALKFLVENEGRPTCYLTTAFFIDSVNRWFDLLSSRYPVMALSKVKMDNYISALEFLDMFQQMIGAMQVGSKAEWKPVQTGVILSTSAIVDIAADLLDQQDFLLTSRLTQDCLENLFSCVRSKNPVPTPREFKYALKVITAAQYLKQIGTGSYQQDDREYLGDLLPARITPPDPHLDLPVLTLFSSSLTADEESSLYYLVGYCIQSLRKLRQLCDTCVDAIRDTTVLPHSSLLLLKNYKSGALFQVRNDIFEVAKNWELVVRSMEPHLKLPNVKDLFVSQCNSAVSIPQELLSLPTCHNVIPRLLGKFVGVRLHIMCKKLNAGSKTLGTSSGALGSKSVAMRHLVKKVR